MPAVLRRARRSRERARGCRRRPAGSPLSTLPVGPVNLRLTPSDTRTLGRPVRRGLRVTSAAVQQLGVQGVLEVDVGPHVLGRPLGIGTQPSSSTPRQVGGFILLERPLVAALHLRRSRRVPSTGGSSSWMRPLSVSREQDRRLTVARRSSTAAWSLYRATRWCPQQASADTLHRAGDEDSAIRPDAGRVADQRRGLGRRAGRPDDRHGLAYQPSSNTVKAHRQPTAPGTICACPAGTGRHETLGLVPAQPRT